MQRGLPVAHGYIGLYLYSDVTQNHYNAPHGVQTPPNTPKARSACSRPGTRQAAPGMYTRTDNPPHIIQEVLDNAADEALAGFGRRSRSPCTRWLGQRGRR